MSKSVQSEARGVKKAMHVGSIGRAVSSYWMGMDKAADATGWLPPTRIREMYVEIVAYCDEYGVTGSDLLAGLRQAIQEKVGTPYEGEEEMAKINMKAYGGAEFPQLTPDDLRRDPDLVTIFEADPTVDFGDGKPAFVVAFEEYPEHKLRINKTQLKYCVPELGEDSDDWIGKTVAVGVVTVNNPQSRSPEEKVWILKPEKWERKRGRKRAAPARRAKVK